MQHARLGGDLPDAVVNGKVLRRGTKAAGLMLYDETGEERGGYVTHTPGSLIALTLDSRSPRQQIATRANHALRIDDVDLGW